MLTPLEIARRLSSAPPIVNGRDLGPGLFHEPARPAAVLIALTRPHDPAGSGAAWHAVYTRRADTVADHKGQVAFPGGRADPGDDFPVGTALREAREEIGLHPADVAILGVMESLYTISNYLVTPVIGMIPWNYAYTPEPGEVSRVFSIPLDWLAEEDHFEIRQRSVTFPTAANLQTLRVVYFNEYDQELLWGISAEITLRLLVKLGLLAQYR